MTPILPAVLVFVAVALGMVALVLGFEALRGSRQRRTLVERLEALEHDLAEANSPGAGVLRGEAGELPFLELMAARFPRLRDLGLILEQGAVGWSVQTFLVITLGAGAGAGLIALLFTGKLIVAAGLAAAGLSLPYLYVTRRRTKRLRAFEEQLPEAIDLMGRALRAGHPFTAGLKMVADEIPDPAGEEFRRVYEQNRFGLSLTDTLLSLGDRVGVIDLRIFITAVLIQREVGGNLAEILDKIAYTIRERFMIRRQIRVHTAQGRMTGYLLAALPICTALVFLVINPEYMLTLFHDPMGHFFIGVALFLQFVGFLWIRKIVDVEF
jgi:tight adherence protein B